MRARRGVYLAFFLLAALGASALVFVAQPRNGVVRASTDIPVLTPITADMVQLVSVSPADAPANAARRVDDVVGKYASAPILAGQDVDVRVLETNPGQLAFGFGAPLEAGQVAFAIPVEPGQAVGGALVPGARVDIVAVPNALKTQVSGTDAPSAVVLGQGLVVLTIRTPEGRQLGGEEAADSARVVIPPKLGSVVVAIPAARLPEFAEAALSSTFYLALSPVAAP
ncbi:MAG: RcpC/CpaB family pilus assembly protein [Chloroflexota bacterium]